MAIVSGRENGKMGSHLNAQSFDLFAPAHLKLVRFPARSPLPIAALPSMSLFPKAPFDLPVCPSMSLASPRLHSRAEHLIFEFSLGRIAPIETTVSGPFKIVRLMTSVHTACGAVASRRPQSATAPKFFASRQATTKPQVTCLCYSFGMAGTPACIRLRVKLRRGRQRITHPS
jgi:hypothetical protein